MATTPRRYQSLSDAYSRPAASPPVASGVTGLATATGAQVAQQIGANHGNTQLRPQQPQYPQAAYDAAATLGLPLPGGQPQYMPRPQGGGSTTMAQTGQLPQMGGTVNHPQMPGAPAGSGGSMAGVGNAPANAMQNPNPIGGGNPNMNSTESWHTQQIIDEMLRRQAMSTQQKQVADRGVFGGSMQPQPMAQRPPMSLPALYAGGR